MSGICLGLTVVLYILYKYIYKYKMLYIAFWAIAACLWVLTLPNAFCFLCELAGGFILAFALWKPTVVICKSCGLEIKIIVHVHHPVVFTLDCASCCLQQWEGSNYAGVVHQVHALLTNPACVTLSSSWYSK